MKRIGPNVGLLLALYALRDMKAFISVWLLLIGLLLALYIVSNQQTSVLNTHASIEKCKPGESPSTHLCFDTSLP